MLVKQTAESKKTVKNMWCDIADQKTMILTIRKCRFYNYTIISVDDHFQLSFPGLRAIIMQARDRL